MLKRVVYETDRELEGLEWLANVIDFSVSLTVFTSINELYTAHMMLRDRKDLYKHKVKLYANEACDAAKVKYGQELSLMTNRGYFDTYADKVVDLAADDITKFRISIKQTLDNNKYDNSELVSYIETARALLDAAKIHFQVVVETAAEDYSEDLPNMPKAVHKMILKKKWTETFAEFNMERVLKSWEKVCNIVYINKGDIDLNTKRSTELFDNLCRKFSNGDYVDACMKEANEQYPEFLENKIKVMME